MIESVNSAWKELKLMYDVKTNGNSEYGENFEIGGELDMMSLALVTKLGELTEELGWDAEVENVPLEMWKKRVWNLIENAGLLEECESVDEDEDENC